MVPVVQSVYGFIGSVWGQLFHKFLLFNLSTLIIYWNRFYNGFDNGFDNGFNNGFYNGFDNGFYNSFASSIASAAIASISLFVQLVQLFQ